MLQPDYADVPLSDFNFVSGRGANGKVGVTVRGAL